MLALEDMGYAEIAEVLGISESNVGARLTRARQLLRVKRAPANCCASRWRNGNESGYRIGNVAPRVAVGNRRPAGFAPARGAAIALAEDRDRGRHPGDGRDRWRRHGPGGALAAV